MSITPKNQAYKREAEARRDAFLNVTSAFSKKCSKCGTNGGKTRIYSLSDGLFCKHCLPEEVKPFEAAEAEKEYRQALEEEANKPKPEGYGGWA